MCLREYGFRDLRSRLMGIGRLALTTSAGANHTQNRAHPEKPMPSVRRRPHQVSGIAWPRRNPVMFTEGERRLLPGTDARWVWVRAKRDLELVNLKWVSEVVLKHRGFSRAIKRPQLAELVWVVRCRGIEIVVCFNTLFFFGIPTRPVTRKLE